MSKSILLTFTILLTAIRAFAWTDGELLIWVSDNRGFRAMEALGKKFEEEMGVPVKVETHQEITDKFQSAAQGGKGPDIFFWAHDRIGEWADAGLLKPLEISEEFKAGFIPMSWEGVTHNKQLWGYPLALECTSLIFNKKITDKPPTQLSEFPAFAKELQAKDPKVVAIMWDYAVPYFSFPFLASAGAFSFKQTPDGYDLKDLGVDNAGAIEGLTAIVNLVKEGVLPKGSTQSVMEQKMGSGELATMVSGPWAWANLRKSGVDFALSVVPGVGGNPGKPFVGVWTAMINRATTNSDLAQQFLEKYICTVDGLKTIDADAPLGVPAITALADEMSAANPLIKVTYENARNGVIMPNIPQMAKFWKSMEAAFKIAINGEATPEVALKDARRNMEQ